jgi:hypothetical protein
MLPQVPPLPKMFPLMRWPSLGAAKSTSPDGPPPAAGKSPAPQRQNPEGAPENHPAATNPVAEQNQNLADRSSLNLKVASFKCARITS